ncbi:hypothetical protein HNY73_021646 [Argiope bruennichi]|uniref:Uncharacterized protein n=1 Tax=Argiope bruennichi TaxID=94029 RepID=A0A8T0E0I6_ARGBR|nr:hypothetical protein HNY73_021646 [Argiope bruennichi]
MPLPVALLLAALAAVDATVLAPGLLNAGIYGPAAVSTGSVVAIPGAVTTDKRIISTTGLIAGAPLLNAGIIGNGLLANGLIGAPVLNSGLIAGAPLLNAGIVSPIGLKSAGILAAPGVVKTIFLEIVTGNGLLINGLIGAPVINSGLINGISLASFLRSAHKAGILAAFDVIKNILNLFVIKKRNKMPFLSWISVFYSNKNIIYLKASSSLVLNKTNV